MTQMTPTSIPAAPSTAAGRSLRALCSHYTKDARAVVEALIQEGADTLLIREPRATQIAELWQADRDRQTELERQRQADALAERERRRLFDQGIALRDLIKARALDLSMTNNMIDHESEVTRLAKLEARLELELEEHRDACEGWATWKEDHPEMAAAVETHLAAGNPTATAPGLASVESLPDYEKPTFGTFT
jgi:hypothetical protein